MWDYAPGGDMQLQSVLCHTLHALPKFIWVVVKLRVPFWLIIVIRHLLFRVPEKGP